MMGGVGFPQYMTTSVLDIYDGRWREEYGMETDKKLSALFSIVLCARLSLRPARMFDDCLHDNSLLAELKEQSSNKPVLGPCCHWVRWCCGQKLFGCL